MDPNGPSFPPNGDDHFPPVKDPRTLPSLTLQLTGNPIPKPTKELKVEDALLYLDQVKVEFSDKPHIYNEFLDIMKNFKAQSINTPGVIEKVKNLFKGYNKLILGFNTFLPEGEGYKIELTPEEEGYDRSHNPANIAAAQAAAAAAAAAQGGVPTPVTVLGADTIALPPKGGLTNPLTLIPGSQALPGFVPVSQQHIAPAPPTGTVPGISGAAVAAQPAVVTASASAPAVGAGGAAGAGPPGQMQQAHAIHYVTKIRNRFSQEPETYRQFLRILHTYQKEQKGIKEVLEQVSNLFADHSDLLMEFTYFLPDAVQEQAKERLERAARESEARKAKLQAKVQKKANAAAQAQAQAAQVQAQQAAAAAANGGANTAASGASLQSQAAMHAKMFGYPLGAAPAPGGSQVSAIPVGMTPSVQDLMMNGMNAAQAQAMASAMATAANNGQPMTLQQMQQMHQALGIAPGGGPGGDVGSSLAGNKRARNSAGGAVAGAASAGVGGIGGPLGGALSGLSSGTSGGITSEAISLAATSVSKGHSVAMTAQLLASQYPSITPAYALTLAQAAASGLAGIGGVGGMGNGNGSGSLTPEEIAYHQALTNATAGPASKKANTAPGVFGGPTGAFNPAAAAAAAAAVGVTPGQAGAVGSAKKQNRRKNAAGGAAGPGGANSAAVNATNAALSAAAAAAGLNPLDPAVAAFLANASVAAAAAVASATATESGVSGSTTVSSLKQAAAGLTPVVRESNSSSSSGLQNQPPTRPRESHLGMSAERKFFDQMKDVLLSISRDSWSDFVKCLDMFTNDALPKDEMLEVVSELLGPNNISLYHEFKRLLDNRHDYQERKEDLWFSVPLSEIDYSQCRKCTPSYRALPRDYPKPKCSERNEEEEKVLNDVWVSIPIGSEESYSFKHMRKNQYEEALFKCEDERFEIDMIIDSNMSTIRILEPLAEEIASLKSLNAANNANQTNGVKNNGTATNNTIVPRFSLQLDKRHLSTIHLNSIARIYGEHGEEILELLRKNPAGTIPVILRRLRQKDTEWRKARNEMNKQWKDVLDKNHYKSFDHRSFYFKQHDRKYLSTKQLVQEVQLAVNSPNGVIPPPAPVVPSLTDALTAAAASIAPSSSALSGSVAVTAPSTSNNAGADIYYSFGEGENEYLSIARDSGLVPEDTPATTADVESNVTTNTTGNPPGVMVLRYEHDSHFLHREIYRIVCHAAETHTLSPALTMSDRERISALWRDLLRMFFNIPTHYMYNPTSAVNTSTSTSYSIPKPIAAEAWSNGTRVLTTLGSGTVMSYREEDGIYTVKLLGFGAIAYLNAASIIGAEQLPPSAIYAIGVSNDPNTGKDVIYGGLVNENTLSTKTYRVRDPSKLFYGTQLCYVFLRLHHTLFSRLRVAYQLAQEAVASSDSQALRQRMALAAAAINGESDPSLDDTAAASAVNPLPHAVDGSGVGGGDTAVVPVFKHFLSQVFALVENSIDNTRFEDFSRSLLGNKSYVLYTLDKIITQLMKHLQAMANDENVAKLVGLFLYHHNHRGEDINSGLYQNHVAHILSHTMEEVYRIQLVCPSSGIMAPYSDVAIQPLGGLTVSSTPAQIAEALNAAANATVSAPGKEAQAMEVEGDAVATTSTLPPTVGTPGSGMRSRLNSFVTVNTSGDGDLLSFSQHHGVNTPKTPKVVVSDDEDDEEEEEDVKGAMDVEDDEDDEDDDV